MSEVTSDGFGHRPTLTADPHRRETAPHSMQLGERYLLDRLIGAGGMGAVWRATDLRLKRTVAVKLVSVTEPNARHRFTREARLTGSIDHPGIVRVHDVGDLGSTCFLVMELLTGETLAGRHARAPMSLGEVMRVVGDLAETMTVAHGAGLVHRDLKPDNVFLHGDGATARTVIIDFGLGFALDGDPEVGRLTRGDVIAGTPAYMSPEQTRAEPIGPPSDVYAIGCILFELLAGQPPFTGVPAVLLAQHAFAAPPRLRSAWAEAPVVLDDLVDAMLAKDGSDRPTVAAVATACRTVGVQLARSDDGATLRERAAVATTPRSSRAISRVAPAMTDDVELGTVLVVGAIPDPTVLALAAAGLAAVRGAAADIGAGDCDIVLVTGVEPSVLATLVGSGRPVVAVHDDSVASVLALIKVGLADAVAPDADGATVARKVARALRWSRAAGDSRPTP